MWVQFVLISLLIYFIFLLLLNPQKRGKNSDKENHLPPGLNSFLDLFLFGITRFGIPNYVLSAMAGKIFGPVYGVKFPTQYAIGVTDLELAKTVMSSDWINRLPDDHILYEGTSKKPLGLLFSNGEHWRQSRRFTVRTLHNFGFHQQHNMENFISFEMNELQQKLDQQLKESEDGNCDLNPHHMFALHTLNIIWQLIAGVRFDYNDPDADMLLNTCNYFNRQFNLGATMVDILPWLRHIPGLRAYHDSWVKSHQVFFEFFQKIIQERRSKGLYHDQPSDFIDFFLKEIDNHAGDEPNYFTDESFIAVMTDMVLGGADTTNSSLEFAVLHMALNPAIQKRVQDEIDEHIGQDRDPCFDDRKTLVYTQAVIMEVLRHASSVPIASRSPLEDSYLNDYFIPKGTLVGVNIHAVHFSQKLWPDPDLFRPERFLNDNNEIINTDKIIPFGFGKRVCIGESLARVSLFIFFTQLVQKYSFETSKNHPLPVLGNVCGLSRCPVSYYVNFRKRIS